MSREKCTAEYTATVNPMVASCFTKRQRELMALIGSGMRLKDAAQKLGITDKTAANIFYGNRPSGRSTNLDEPPSIIGVGGVIERETGKRPAIGSFRIGMINAGILTIRRKK